MSHVKDDDKKIPSAFDYKTEKEQDEIDQLELELDIAVKYCVEYAKQGALGSEAKDLSDAKPEDVKIQWKVQENQRQGCLGGTCRSCEDSP